jgi:hypothetical protein
MPFEIITQCTMIDALFIFNAIVDRINLREMYLFDKQFTWANNLQTTIFEKIDVILVITDWESQSPKTTVQALLERFHIIHLSAHLTTGTISTTIKIELHGHDSLRAPTSRWIGPF